MNTDSILLLIFFALVCILLVLTYWVWITVLQRKEVATKPVKSNIERPVMQPKASTTREVSDESNTLERVVQREAENSSITYRGNVCISSDDISDESSDEYEDYYNCKKKEESAVDTAQDIIDEAILKKKMRADGILRGLNNYIKDSMERWKELKINIAVTGTSGAGKSSLINALRKVKPSDEGAADVGVVEKTNKKQKYTYLNNKNVALWDLPGVGTRREKKENYLDRMDIASFDVVLIVSAVRFHENDIWLGNAVCAMKKNVIYVRTKIDLDMMNAKRDYPHKFSEVNSLEEIKTNLKEDIPEPNDYIYLVSSPKRSLYDFSELEKHLIGIVNTKGKEIREILQSHAEAMINVHKKIAKEKFSLTKASSILYGFLPIPLLEDSLSKEAVSRVRKFCLKLFCIDETSLDRIADDLKTSKADLQGRLKHYSKCDPDNILLLENVEKKHHFMIRYAKYCVPILGSLTSAAKMYTIICECLETIVDVMAEDELTLVELRLEKLEENLKAIK